MSKRPPFKETEASRPDFEKGYDIHYTKTPQPDWKPGGGLNDLPQAADFDPTKSQWRVIDPAQHEKAQIYKFMTSAITPRPIAFLSTMDKDGVCNLSPMSYFNMVSHNPPTIMISVSSNPKTESGLKDTSKNIRDLKEFCCSIISEPFLEAANYTAIDAPPDVDEWALSGLTKRASDTVKPPHVGEAGISMECELEHWHDLKKDDGTVSNTIILGRVKRFQTKEFLFDSSDPMKVLPEKLRSVHRLGGISYGRTVQMIDLPRPSWDTAKDDPDVQSILGGSEKQPSSTL